MKLTSSLDTEQSPQWARTDGPAALAALRNCTLEDGPYRLGLFQVARADLIDFELLLQIWLEAHLWHFNRSDSKYSEKIETVDKWMKTFAPSVNASAMDGWDLEQQFRRTFEEQLFSNAKAIQGPVPQQLLAWFPKTFQPPLLEPVHGRPSRALPFFRIKGEQVAASLASRPDYIGAETNSKIQDDIQKFSDAQSKEHVNKFVEAAISILAFLRDCADRKADVFWVLVDRNEYE